ncbi:MAG: hypothetical protein H6733_07470 [Alphaproteobacteria bacterium]|nr:hypothetical protein [Alphaproteobacteria bacterium]
MARWLVNRNDTQFAVNGLSELRDMAIAGKLGPGDMIQPPGATDWLYAVEIDELKEHLQHHGGHGDDDLDVARGGGAARYALIALLLAVAAGGGAAMYSYSQQMSDTNVSLLDQISFSQLVVTGKGVSLVAEPDRSASTVGSVSDGTVLELLAKRGDFYKTRDDRTGATGWVPVDQVMPMYRIGGQDVMKEYDPLYNPDRYLVIQNAGWMQLPEQTEEQITVFQFMLRNQSDYDMTDLVMVARIKDAKGHELEQVEFKVDGIVPAHGVTMVGTLVTPDSEERRLITQNTFDTMAAADPELRLEYNDGVEVKMQTADFTEASIDIVELRAVPKTATSG